MGAADVFASSLLRSPACSSFPLPLQAEPVAAYMHRPWLSASRACSGVGCRREVGLRRNRITSPS